MIDAVEIGDRRVHRIEQRGSFRGRHAGKRGIPEDAAFHRSEEHTSELQSLMRISYAVFCLKKKKIHHKISPTKTSLIHEYVHVQTRYDNHMIQNKIYNTNTHNICNTTQ